jgi:hypothetical protein
LGVRLARRSLLPAAAARSLHTAAAASPLLAARCCLLPLQACRVLLAACCSLPLAAYCPLPLAATCCCCSQSPNPTEFSHGGSGTHSHSLPSGNFARTALGHWHDCHRPRALSFDRPRALSFDRSWALSISIRFTSNQLNANALLIPHSTSDLIFSVSPLSSRSPSDVGYLGRKFK